MKFDEPFDPSQHEPQDDFGPIPNGWYAARIKKAEQRTNKAATGSYLQIEFEIDAATHRNIGPRVLFDRLNLWNPNEKAVAIAQQSLADICRAVGIPNLTDTDQLLGQRLAIRVVVRPAERGYEASNEVKRYGGADDKVGPPGEDVPADPGMPDDNVPF